jgi:hypothetical protein
VKNAGHVRAAYPKLAAAIREWTSREESRRPPFPANVRVAIRPESSDTLADNASYGQWANAYISLLGCCAGFGLLKFHFHSFQERKEMLPVFRSANQFLGADGIVRNKVVEAIGVDFSKCLRIDQPLVKHDLTVLEEAHVSLDFGPFLRCGGTGPVSPSTSCPEAPVDDVMFGEPVPEIKPETSTVCPKSQPGVNRGERKRCCRDKNANDGGDVLNF